MSYIADSARTALANAAADFAKARRTLFAAAAVLALLHLLTVAPYIERSRELAAIEKAVAANEALLADINLDSAALTETSQTIAARLQRVLERATAQMIDRFQELRPLVQDALRGKLPPAASVAGIGPSTLQIPQMQAQMPLSAVPNMPRIREPAAPSEAAPVDPALREALVAIADGNADAERLMRDYAESAIVDPAYREAERVWQAQLRPEYARVLAKLVAATGSGAARARKSENQERILHATRQLREAAGALEALKIRRNDAVYASLGADWWATVGGKLAYAGSLTAAIQQQMDEIAAIARMAADAMGEVVALQKKLQAEAKAEQARLEKQFAAQQAQLTSLSGIGGALPLDLKSFIALFPAVLGLVLALLWLRAAEERRKAAVAAHDLHAAAPTERETLDWLRRQAVGGRSIAVPVAVDLMLAAVFCAWVWLAQAALTSAPVAAALSPTQSALVGTAAIGFAAAWGLAALWSLRRVP